MERKLLLHEDFTGNTLNEDLWNINVGNRWANAELQAYTKENLSIVDNTLIITGLTEEKMERHFTSARIDTRNKFSFQNGLVEIVAKLPKAIGSWPAIWLMPENTAKLHWPDCGEIDIMEHCGHKLDKAFFSIHTKHNNHVIGNGFTKTMHIKGITDDFHKYSFLWEKDKLTWMVDDKVCFSVDKVKDLDESYWPFDQQYYIIINMAIGGNFCEGQLEEADFPCEFLIKSVKVYGEEK